MAAPQGDVVIDSFPSLAPITEDELAGALGLKDVSSEESAQKEIYQDISNQSSLKAESAVFASAAKETDAESLPPKTISLQDTEPIAESPAVVASEEENRLKDVPKFNGMLALESTLVLAESKATDDAIAPSTEEHVTSTSMGAEVSGAAELSEVESNDNTGNAGSIIDVIPKNEDVKEESTSTTETPAGNVTVPDASSGFVTDSEVTSNEKVTPETSTKGVEPEQETEAPVAIDSKHETSAKQDSLAEPTSIEEAEPEVALATMNVEDASAVTSLETVLTSDHTTVDGATDINPTPIKAHILESQPSPETDITQTEEFSALIPNPATTETEATPTEVPAAVSEGKTGIPSKEEPVDKEAPIVNSLPESTAQIKATAAPIELVVADAPAEVEVSAIEEQPTVSSEEVKPIEDDVPLLDSTPNEVEADTTSAVKDASVAEEPVEALVEPVLHEKEGTPTNDHVKPIEETSANEAFISAEEIVTHAELVVSDEKEQESELKEVTPVEEVHVDKQDTHVDEETLEPAGIVVESVQASEDPASDKGDSTALNEGDTPTEQITIPAEGVHVQKSEEPEVAIPVEESVAVPNEEPTTSEQSIAPVGDKPIKEPIFVDEAVPTAEEDVSSNQDSVLVVEVAGVAADAPVEDDTSPAENDISLVSVASIPQESNQEDTQSAEDNVAPVVVENFAPIETEATGHAEPDVASLEATPAEDTTLLDEDASPDVEIIEPIGTEVTPLDVPVEESVASVELAVDPIAEAVVPIETEAAPFQEGAVAIEGEAIPVETAASAEENVAAVEETVVAAEEVVSAEEVSSIEKERATVVAEDVSPAEAEVIPLEKCTEDVVPSTEETLPLEEVTPIAEDVAPIEEVQAQEEADSIESAPAANAPVHNTVEIPRDIVITDVDNKVSTENETTQVPEPSNPTEIERPRSPWAPSFQVTTVGRGLSPANEIDEPEYVAAGDVATMDAVAEEQPNVRQEAPTVPDISMPVEEVTESAPSTAIQPTEDLESAVLDTTLVPPRPWTPSYSIHSQGSPLQHTTGLGEELPVPLEQIDVQDAATELDEMEFAENTELPAATEKGSSAVEDVQLTTEVIPMDVAPLDETNEVVAAVLTAVEDTPSNDGVAAEGSSPSVPLIIEEDTKAEEHNEAPSNVEPEIPGIVEPEIPSIVEPEIPSIVESEIEAPPTVLLEPLDELSSLEVEPHSEERASPTSWIPSYSVSNQGSPLPKAIELVEDINVTALSESDAVSNHTSEQQEAEPHSEERASPTSWVPSYSVSNQGSPLPKTKELVEEVNAIAPSEPDAVSDHTSEQQEAESHSERASPTSWVPSYSVSNQGSPLPKTKELVEVNAIAPSELDAISDHTSEQQESEPHSEEQTSSTSWIPSYSVSNQGSPLPKTKELVEDVNATVPSEPDAVSDHASEQQAEPHSEERASSTSWVPSYSVSNQGSPLPKTKELVEDVNATVPSEPDAVSDHASEQQAEPHSEERASPTSWVPSYSVSNQGSPLPKTKELVEDVSATALSEPDTVSGHTLEQQEIETSINTVAAEPEASDPTEDVPTEEVHSQEEPSSGVATPIVVIIDETGHEDQSHNSVTAEASEGRPKSPWTPSYSVSRQGLDSPLEEAEIDNLKPLSTRTPDVAFVSDIEASVSDSTEEGSTAVEGEARPTMQTSEESDKPPKVDVTPEVAVATTAEVITATMESESTDVTEESTPGANVMGDKTPTNKPEEFPTIEDSDALIAAISRLVVEEPADSDNSEVQTGPDFPSARKRLESTTSSRFFPGGWFSSTPKVADETRPSLEVAQGEFSSSKPTSPVDDVSDSVSDSTTGTASTESVEEPEEKHAKGRWCVIM
ncbi:hypothetical protein BDQ12DRAFT_734312 [Crucibulum laeve]|uniref:Uncharacterized protein n=1 Tax=Crucibulum laeve TaxID=68775 RepID=A0A5C3M6P1_9AGAR|nr:hypothetical protein BDQ12DRAFT_734312 [Crucibulum laeve]